VLGCQLLAEATEALSAVGAHGIDATPDRVTRESPDVPNL
jgi:hypothetical protein